MTSKIALLGLGEAGRAFAAGFGGRITAYDRKTDRDDTRQQKMSEANMLAVPLALSNAEAVTGATAILSLVTADQALPAALQSSEAITAGALYLDMNSVAPATKQHAARLIEAAGGHYVDVAVMSPVLPARRAAPLLVSGPQADAGVAMLRELGFSDVRSVGDAVGAASSIKMIRSVMVKGIEALSAECAIAADAAGVRAEVIASLDASWPGAGWEARFDYSLDRMMVHGLRRAAEMDEVVATLDALGTGSPMTRGTVERQRLLGGLGIAPPRGLDAKLDLLRPFTRTSWDLSK